MDDLVLFPPPDVTQYLARIEALQALGSSGRGDPPLSESTQTIIQQQITLQQDKIDALLKENHAVNAIVVAEHIVQKYRQYGPLRFTNDSSVDFYDGSVIENDIVMNHKVEFSHDLIEALQILRPSNATTIMQLLHVGTNSLQRFQSFIWLGKSSP
jgi:hypothetical protein